MPGKRDKRTLVFDAFAQVTDDDPVVIVWPGLALDAPQAEVLDALLENLGFLVRAESWVDALKPDQKKLMTIFHDDWLNTIGVETGELQAAGWNSPPCEGQVRAELRRRGLPDLATPPMVTLPSDKDAAGRQARRFRHFARTRRDGGRLEPPPGLFHLTFTLQSPVTGPLCLGWGCHFGLGSFVPTPR